MANDTITDKIFRYLLSLIYEKDSEGKWKLSTGRVSWWLALSPAVYNWFGGGDIQPQHLAALTLLAAYNFGKHGLEAVKSIKTKKSEEE